jgi:hypothetical protein
MVRAPSGNFTNSLSAAFIHDTGRDLRVSAIRYSAPYMFFMLSYLTTIRNCPFEDTNVQANPLPGTNSTRGLGALTEPPKGEV